MVGSSNNLGFAVSPAAAEYLKKETLCFTLAGSAVAPVLLSLPVAILLKCGNLLFPVAWGWGGGSARTPRLGNAALH